MNKLMISAVIVAATLATTAAWSQTPPAAPAAAHLNTSKFFEDPLEKDPSRVVRMQNVIVPPGWGNEFHMHPGDQWWAILDGEVVYTIKGKPPVVLKAGDHVYTPRGTIHRNQNLSDKPAHIIELNITDKGAKNPIPAPN